MQVPALGRARPGVVGLVAVAGIAASLVVSVQPQAQAFDCYSTEPAPRLCPFVKVEKSSRGDSYDVTGRYLSASGRVLHEWQERDPQFTLWHWRWYGANETIEITVTSSVPPSATSSGASVSKKFTFPANESRCIIVQGRLVARTDGCSDFENPPSSQ